MDTRKAMRKEEKQDDIVILDEGIDTKSIIEPQYWVCCLAAIFPYRWW
jgi:hypothetical protein